MPWKRSTTVDFENAPARTTRWPAEATSLPVPVRVTVVAGPTGRSTCSLATSTRKTESAAAHARALTRSGGTRPEVPRDSWSTATLPALTPGAACTSTSKAWPSRAASSWMPRSRLRGVNRQTSSRPVGTTCSATSKDPTGCRWLSTFSGPISSASRTLSVATVTESVLPGYSVVTAASHDGSSRRRGRDASVAGARSAQPTAPSICSSMSRLSSRAYSIGSSLAIGSTKPRTIIAIASSCSMPRDIR